LGDSVAFNLESDMNQRFSHPARREAR
jgi:hypothetical protein